MQFIQNCHLFLNFCMRVCIGCYFLNWARYSPHFLIRVLSSIRIFLSAFYPPSAFSDPRFILHPHFLVRVLSPIRIFSSAFYPQSAFSHPYFLIRIRHPYPSSVSASVSAFYPYPLSRLICTLCSYFCFDA